MNPRNFLEHFGQPVYLTGISALDYYYQNFRRRSVPVIYLSYQGSLAQLSRDFDTLEFPGLPGADALISIDDTTFVFEILDGDDPGHHFHQLTPPPLRLLYDFRTRKYIHLEQTALALKSKKMLGPEGWLPTSPSPDTALDAAVYAARFPLADDQEGLLRNLSPRDPSFWPQANPTQLRLALTLILTGYRASWGLRLLHTWGFFDTYWPFLSAMDRTSHSKECHPEGNVWEHTLSCLDVRKSLDPALAFSLFLHDSGKPRAIRNRNRIFDGHAEIGAELAREFLRDLEFPAPFVDQVSWLVESHMIPAALSILPRYRTEPYLSNPWFGTLLDLYRCDLASSWRDLGDYHHACALYKSYQRYTKNPYRNLDKTHFPTLHQRT